MQPDVPGSTDVGSSRLATRPAARPLRAVVIGGSGQIGSWLIRSLAQRGHSAIGTYASVQFPGLVHFNASDLRAVADWVAEQAADVVFYPAGFTWVDGCERDRSLAYAANLEQPLNLARAASKAGTRFVYFSTDYVFDGQSGPYSEESATNPLSVYGQAKRDAELGWNASSAAINSRSAPPGSSDLSGRGRILPTSCSGIWLKRNRQFVRQTRYPIRAMGQMSPVPQCFWLKKERAA